MSDQSDLERNTKAKNFLTFIDTEERLATSICAGTRSRQLNDALYTASELGLLKMEGSIEIGTALRIHAIVSSVLAKGFPDRLRMQVMMLDEISTKSELRGNKADVIITDGIVS